MTNQSVFLNSARFELEGSFSIDTDASVKSITNQDGSTKTCRGEFMSTAKTDTGTYVTTVKLASSLDGQPVFQPVETVCETASLAGAALTVALFARVVSVAADANGNLAITVLTTDATGAAADNTTAVVRCSFSVVIEKNRMGGVL